MEVYQRYMQIPKEYSAVFQFLLNVKLLFFRTVLRLSSKKQKVLRVIMIDSEGHLLVYSGEGEPKRKLAIAKDIQAVFYDTSCVVLHVLHEQDLAIEFHPGRSNQADATIRRFLQILANTLPPGVNATRTQKAYDHVKILDARKLKDVVQPTPKTAEGPPTAGETSDTPTRNGQAGSALPGPGQFSRISSFKLMARKEAENMSSADGKKSEMQSNPDDPEDALYKQLQNQQQDDQYDLLSTVVESRKSSIPPVVDEPGAMSPAKQRRFSQGQGRLPPRKGANSMTKSTTPTLTSAVSPSTPQLTSTPPNVSFSSYRRASVDLSTLPPDQLEAQIELDVELEKLEISLKSTRAEIESKRQALQTMREAREQKEREKIVQTQLCTLILAICRRQRQKEYFQEERQKEVALHQSVVSQLYRKELRSCVEPISTVLQGQLSRPYTTQVMEFL